jgi:hypothetical protein
MCSLTEEAMGFSVVWGAGSVGVLMMSSDEPSVSEVCRDDSPEGLPLLLALSRPFLETLCCVNGEGVAESVVDMLSVMTLVPSL